MVQFHLSVSKLQMLFSRLNLSFLFHDLALNNCLWVHGVFGLFLYADFVKGCISLPKSPQARLTRKMLTRFLRSFLWHKMARIKVEFPASVKNMTIIIIVTRNTTWKIRNGWHYINRQKSSTFFLSAEKIRPLEDSISQNWKTRVIFFYSINRNKVAFSKASTYFS